MNFPVTGSRKALLLSSGDLDEGLGLDPNLWEVLQVDDLGDALTAIGHQNFNVGLLYINSITCVEAVELLERLHTEDPDLPWIALVSPDFIRHNSELRFLAELCYDFHTLPINRNHLEATLGHADGMARLARLTSRPRRRHYRKWGMIGESPRMQKVYSDLEKIAPTKAPVLITGETGTGKELAARAIHAASSYSAGPCIEINCGALPPGIIQSELFGYEKGAFTGAAKRKIGRIEAANGGVLFLDEIGDLPHDMQVNLLRFLQEKSIERLGGTEKIPVDLRIVAATHMDLEQAVAQGRFREDLYYRLNVLSLHMPPLRVRRDDIEALAKHYLEIFRAETGIRSVKGYTPEASDAMRCHAWPGNIRELVNRVRRAVVMTDNKLITPLDLGLAESTGEESRPTLEEARMNAEKLAIRRALSETDGNISKTARKLEVSRGTLYRLMEKHRL